MGETRPPYPQLFWRSEDESELFHHSPVLSARGGQPLAQDTVFIFCACVIDIARELFMSYLSPFLK